MVCFDQEGEQESARGGVSGAIQKNKKQKLDQHLNSFFMEGCLYLCGRPLTNASDFQESRRWLDFRCKLELECLIAQTPHLTTDQKV